MKRSWGEYVHGTYRLPQILAGVFAYVLLTALYMQPVIAHGCSQTFLGGPGDQSAFAWLYQATPNAPPLWGFTSLTNAPYGENVSEPMYIIGAAQYTSVWVMQKVVGPTCAFNLYISFGFLFTATVMFLFLLWLTGRRSYFAAWFGGYLLAFSPYLQAKTPYHASYVFAGLLVLLLWALLAYWRSPSLKKAGLGMVIFASLFYHDPYFIMLAGFLLLSVIIATVLYHRSYDQMRSWRDWYIKLKPALLLMPLFLLLISPVIYVRIAQSQHIDAVVSSSRDTNIIDEGVAYGARPWEYLLPAATSPLTPESLRDFQFHHQHGATTTETTLFLGYIPLLLAGVYTVYWFRKGRRRKDRDAKKGHYATLAAMAMMVVAGVMSLPPSFHVGPLTLYFPSWILLHLTTMWRVPARLVVVVQIGLIILAVFGLLYLLNRYRVRFRLEGVRLYTAFVAIIIVSLAEYAAFNPFQREYWTYSMTPSVYTEIKDDSKVKMIAEYPILEPPRNGAFIYYLTYQSYHQKPMINTAKASSPNKQYRESLTDIGDWQTLGALRQLGVGRVIFHESDSGSVAMHGLINKQDAYDAKTKSRVLSYAISSDIVPKSYLLTLSDGFDGPSNYGFADIDYYMHQSGELRPVLLPGAKAQQTATARIEYYGFEKVSRTVKIIQDSKVVAEVRPAESKQVIEFTIDPSKPISIMPTNPPSDYSFVISNMEIR